MTKIDAWLEVFEYRMSNNIICEFIDNCEVCVTDSYFIANCMDQIGKLHCKYYYSKTKLPKEYLKEVKNKI